MNFSHLFLQNLLQFRPPLLEFLRRDVRDGQDEAVAGAQKVDLQIKQKNEVFLWGMWASFTYKYGIRTSIAFVS